MPGPLIPALAAGGGALLSFLGKKREHGAQQDANRSQWEAQRSQIRSQSAQRAAKNAMFRSILQEAGVDVESMIPADVLDEILSTIDIGDFVPGAGPSVFSALGGGLQSLSPFLPGSPYSNLLNSPSGLRAGSGMPQGFPGGGSGPVSAPGGGVMDPFSIPTMPVNPNPLPGFNIG